MKIILSLLLFFAGYLQVQSQENLKVQNYSVLKFIGPDTNSKAAAQYTEKTHTLPAYKIALNAYKQLIILAKRTRLNSKQAKLAEKLKEQIQDYKLWLKITKLYHASHFSEIIQKANADLFEETSDKPDPIDQAARSINRDISKKIWSLLKENEQLTKKKGFVHPVRATYKAALRNPVKGKELPQKLREKLLKVLQDSMEKL